MATHVLTTTDPITGLTKSFLGWQVSPATLADVYEGCNKIWEAGWDWHIGRREGTGDKTATPPTPPDWWLQLTLENVTAVAVDVSEWFVFDGKFVQKLTDAEVTENYTKAAAG